MNNHEAIEINERRMSALSLEQLEATNLFKDYVSKCVDEEYQALRLSNRALLSVTKQSFGHETKIYRHNLKYYVLLEDVNMSDSKFLCLSDMYTYTIPIASMEFVTDSTILQYYKKVK